MTNITIRATDMELQDLLSINNMPSITQEAKSALIEQFMKISNGPFGVTNAIHIVESFPVSEPILPQGKNDDGWIPVSERLPTHCAEILIQKRDSGICIGLYADGVFADENNERVPVTHWQPLPNPPTSHK